MLPDICVVGKAGAGKTTVSELLVKSLDYHRMSFAAPLKVMCDTTVDRALLQRVGQGVRDLYPDAWVNLFLASLHTDYTTRAVVDDCRYPNELLALRSEGFYSVRVVAGRNLRVSRLRANGKLADEAELDHESETALDHSTTDYTIINEGTPWDLSLQVNEMLNKVTT